MTESAYPASRDVLALADRILALIGARPFDLEALDASLAEASALLVRATAIETDDPDWKTSIVGTAVAARAAAAAPFTHGSRLAPNARAWTEAKREILGREAALLRESMIARL